MEKRRGAWWPFQESFCCSSPRASGSATPLLNSLHQYLHESAVALQSCRACLGLAIPCGLPCHTLTEQQQQHQVSSLS